MVELGSILTKLRNQQLNLAISGTLQPPGTTQFDFGLLVGQVRGIQESLDLIEAMIKDEEQQ